MLIFANLLEGFDGGFFNSADEVINTELPFDGLIVGAGGHDGTFSSTWVWVENNRVSSSDHADDVAC